MPAATVVPVNLIDVYQGRPGTSKWSRRSLDAPPAGTVASILAACGGPLHTYVFRIRAHTAARSVRRHFNGLPAGARCTVTEVAIGRTSKVRVVAIGRRHRVTIRPNGKTIVHITDTFRRIVSLPLPPVTTG